MSMSCYVCLDTDSTERVLKVCDCTDRYVHRSCQMKWIQTSGLTQCSVCQASFRNVNIDTGYRLQLSPYGKKCCILSPLYVAILCATGVYTYIWVCTGHHLPLLLLHVSTCIFFTVQLCMLQTSEDSCFETVRHPAVITVASEVEEEADTELSRV